MEVKEKKIEKEKINELVKMKNKEERRKKERKTSKRN